MTDVNIEYDPYEMKTTMEVDGKKYKGSKSGKRMLKECLDENKRIPMQSWIEPNMDNDWQQGLLGALIDLDDNEFKINFSGRKIDYEYLKTSLELQNEKLGDDSVKLSFELKREMLSDSEMKKNIDKVVALMLDEKFAKIVEESSDKDSELKDKYKNLKQAYEEINIEEFRIAFAGPYSSGKSTLINALVKKNILPMSQGTCTSRICKIIHDKNRKYNIKVECYNEKGKIINKFDCTSDIEVQGKINEVGKEVEEIRVYMDLGDLYPSNIDIENDFKLMLIDTPGTDSGTGNDTDRTDDEQNGLSKKSHLEITKGVLQSKSKEMVVLIANENLEIDSIRHLLNIIEEEASNQDGFNDRFLFVMNKADNYSYNSNEKMDDRIHEFVKNITAGGKRDSIIAPRIFPVSSAAALAIENDWIEEKEGDPEEKTNLFDVYDNLKKRAIVRKNKLYFLEEYCSVSPMIHKKYEEQLANATKNSEKVMIHSGIPSLVSAIQEYLGYYAYPIKVRRLMSCFEDIVIELNSLNEQKKAKLEDAKKNYGEVTSSGKQVRKEEKENQKKKEKLKKIEEEMKETKKKIDEIPATIPQIDEQRSEFFGLKNELVVPIINKYVETVDGKKMINEEHRNEFMDAVDKFVDIIEESMENAVREVRRNKRQTTEKLYNEFINYMRTLEKDQFLKIDGFSLKDTVGYQKIIDKESFKEIKTERIQKKNQQTKKDYVAEKKKEEKNKSEYYYTWGKYGQYDGIRLIKLARGIWAASKKAKEEYREYINVSYISVDDITEITDSIEKDFRKYVEDIKENYRGDINNLKEETKQRIDQVKELIEEYDQKIKEIESEAIQIASDADKYKKRMSQLETEKMCLEQVSTLISDKYIA